MGENTAVPTGVERRMPADEFIVTKTDLKGHITYANDLFCRMAAMDEADVLGKPHNIIRHPDMPRAVFRLLWDSVSAGNEVFAYVNNLAADGANYWVFAHVTPSRDASGTIIGYHSNRRAPDRSAVTAAASVYRQLLAEERRHGSGPAAAAAGTRLLNTVLADEGVTYDEFIWSITPETTR